MRIKRSHIKEIINEYEKAKSTKDHWAMMGFLDFLVNDCNISLERIQKSVRKYKDMDSRTFWHDVRKVGYLIEH